jgi:hypothetical protein
MKIEDVAAALKDHLGKLVDDYVAVRQTERRLDHTPPPDLPFRTWLVDFDLHLERQYLLRARRNPGEGVSGHFVLHDFDLDA